MDHPLARRGTGFALLCALLFGVFLLWPADTAPPAPRTGALGVRDRAAGPGGGTATAVRAPVAPLARSVPKRLVIDALRLDAPLVPVGLGTDGLIDPPRAAGGGPAGWYAGAAAPGERGTSVVVGHVDGPDGPAVFYPLGSLEPGSRIEITRADGTTAVFAVDRVAVHPRRDFPAREVYRDGPRPELRLITCAGRFTRGTGYDSNVVVSAHLIGSA
ncbi:class F sortase [Streptomyces sp. NPDC000594]|uniref:class F sortase n=1 Tax=Streptomyces sp. NPDC000594 TaxID=3154261 RepID=UPI003324A4D4